MWLKYKFEFKMLQLSSVHYFIILQGILKLELPSHLQHKLEYERTETKHAVLLEQVFIQVSHQVVNILRELHEFVPQPTFLRSVIFSNF